MTMKNDYDVDFEQYGNAGNGSLRWISMLVMIMVVFGFFSLVWYAYDGGSDVRQDEAIAMIAPEQERYKIKPLDAGGMPIENKDIEAYQLMRRSPDVQTEVNKVETLVSDNEKPINPMTQPPAQDSAMANEMAHMEGRMPAQQPVPSETLVQAPEESSQQAPAPASEQVTQDTLTQAQLELEEKARALQALEKELAAREAAAKAQMQAQTQQTQTVRPVETPVTTTESMSQSSAIDEAIKEATVPAPVRQEIQAQPVAPVMTQPKEPAERPLSSVKKQPVVTTKTIAQAATPAKPAPVAPTQIASAGGATIQFAAMRSASDAGRVWAELKAKHPELSPYSYYTEPVQVAAGGTLYRLKAKGFASRIQAVNVCNAVKSRGQDCLVSAQ